MIIKTQAPLIALLKVGFADLGKFSPMEDLEDLVFSRRLSIQQDSVVWRVYSLKHNKDFMEDKGDGQYEIGVHAKSFVSVNISQEGKFVQISTQCAFNDLQAMLCYNKMKS